MKLKTLSITLLLTCSVLLAQSTPNNDNLIDLEKKGDWIILPYAFSTDATGFTGGIAAIAQGIFQPQTTLVATAFFGADQDITINGNSETSNFSGGFLAFSNLKIPYSNRLFFSFWTMNKATPKGAYYIDGSNDSKKESVLISSGQTSYFYSTLRYVLPIGEGIDNPEGLYKLKNGFAMGREGYGNGVPFQTGKTTIGVQGFYQTQDFENWKTLSQWIDITSKPEWNTQGFKFFLEHDNTDFDLNPSNGYSFKLQYSADWGDNLQSWDFLEFKYSKYFNLEPLPFTQQSVLALNFWTGYSFSWDTSEDIISGIALNRPPIDNGGRLGGMFRMRGYDNNRFSDKAVIYGTAEYRNIINYNPFKNTTLEEYSPIAIDWFQLVAFAEAGRVNDKYDINLLSDLKYDVGLSLRTMAAELPLRFDIAYSDEGTNMWVMIQHPFDF